MSDRYRPPPTGPKGSRNYDSSRNYDPRARNDKPYRQGNEKFPPSGPKRYHERDNYRPSGPSTQPPPAPGAKPPRGPSGPGARPSGPGARPSGPGARPSGPNNLKRGSSPYVSKYNNNKKPKYNGPPPKAPHRQFIPTKLEKHQIYLVRTLRPTEVYQRSQQVGEGTYGKVYKAKNDITGENVALKKLRLESEREGFPITSIREIKLLQSFDHKNIIGLLEMMVEHNQIYMIFDYMEHDLTGLLTHPELVLKESHRKFIFKQLMEGLSYLHGKRVIHRDIKGSNILLDNIGRLKIADFGLARTMKILKDGESPDYTNRVITIWYRPPELLLGSTEYGREIDIWGVGCLLIELYSKMAVFRGFDEVGQLHKIFSIMGTPTFEEWPEIQNLPWFEMLKPKANKVKSFGKLYKSVVSEQAFDLAESLLQLNPKKRLTASQALNHDYFTKDPKPEPLFFLKDLQGEWHEFETKKRRRKERKRLEEEEQGRLRSGESTQMQPQVSRQQTIPPTDKSPGIGLQMGSLNAPSSLSSNQSQERGQEQSGQNGQAAAPTEKVQEQETGATADVAMAAPAAPPAEAEHPAEPSTDPSTEPPPTST